MAREIDGASSSGDPSKDNYDATHWTKSEVTPEGQINTYVGRAGSNDDNHCHSYKSSDGRSGVIHRGECKVCDDESNGNSGTGAQK